MIFMILKSKHWLTYDFNQQMMYVVIEWQMEPKISGQIKFKHGHYIQNFV